MAAVINRSSLETEMDKKPLNLADMASYSEDVDSIRGREFPMLQGISLNWIIELLANGNYPGTTYLDHAGTTLYPKSLMEEFSKEMMSNLLGNPHSSSASSQLTSRRIEDTRLKVLRFFKADPDRFDLVFVANATAGIKLVMDGFKENNNGFWYGYHKDSHTSLIGVRQAAFAGHHCFESDAEVERWLAAEDSPDMILDAAGLGLFAYPAQSNFNGRRLPLSWPGGVRSLGNTQNQRVYTLLDAAALVSTSPLDLSDVTQAPDYTVLSFYKIFGFPDLGALIVRKDSCQPLQRRRYFGGGTVEMVTCVKEQWHMMKENSLHEQLEDGTLPIHSIIALDSALSVHKRLFQSLELVSSHTLYLAKQLYERLSALRHSSGGKVCKIYTEPSAYEDAGTQGPIIAFNLRDGQGEWISNSEVEKLAVIKNIQFRSGGLCNPGGIASSLELAPWEMKRNFTAGQRCGNDNDIIGGKPTGALRVSFGAMSNLQDVLTFFAFVEEFFVDKLDVVKLGPEPNSSHNGFYVETLAIYPIKSCGGWSIPEGVSWDIKTEGLAFDREWCLVHQGTRAALSQKRYPKMALLRPSIDLDNGLLHVRFHGSIPPSTPAEISLPLSADPTLFQHPGNGFSTPYSQVCGDTIVAQTYASKHIADFFTNIVGTPCTLARFPASTSGLSNRHSKAHLQPYQTSTHQKDCRTALSSPHPDAQKRPILLSNESPILTISRSSLNLLNAQIALTAHGKPAPASVFRANIIIAESSHEHPYTEDTWHSMHIGGHKFDVLGPCRRCQMVCVNQDTAEKNEEPFVTLAKTRRSGGRVWFGVHCALRGGKGRARVRVGDRVLGLGREGEGVRSKEGI
jgi:molybdenum cofactor sulfurtransferase